MHVVQAEVELDCRHCITVPPPPLPLPPPLPPLLLPVHAPPELLPEVVSHSLAHEASAHCPTAMSAPWHAPLAVMCEPHEATLQASYEPPGQMQLT
jgi:hypothetical protein